MPAYNNTNEIYQAILKQAEKGMIQTCERIKNELKKYVQDNWYNRDFTPQSYDRTFEFINSITASKPVISSNTISAEIYFDTSKIGSYSSDSGMWGQHQGLNGENVSASIPYYIEDGNKSSVYSYEGIHMVQNVAEWARSNDVPLKEMMNYLKKNGYQVSIK